MRECQRCDYECFCGYEAMTNDNNQQVAREWVVELEKVKHTPGNWYVDAHPNGLRVLSDDARATIIAQNIGPSSNPEAVADASLIAAAPSLLKAAEFALSNLMRNLHSEEVCGQPFMCDDEHQAIAMLSAAIAKAHPAPPRPTQEIRGD